MDAPDVEVEQYMYEIAGWGRGAITVAAGVLLAHDLAIRPRPAASSRKPALFLPNPPEGGASPPEFRLADERARVCADFVPGLVDRVRQQLAGAETTYADIPLDLGWCTPFQAELAAALRAVPWGEIVSYGELAALAGRPGAARAAGSFCAQNRFALVMPCHRVVGAAGIGGYGESGVGLKRRLLALEGVVL